MPNTAPLFEAWCGSQEEDDEVGDGAKGTACGKNKQENGFAKLFRNIFENIDVSKCFAYATQQKKISKRRFLIDFSCGFDHGRTLAKWFRQGPFTCSPYLRPNMMSFKKSIDFEFESSARVRGTVACSPKLVCDAFDALSL